jgi:hypothetical protein
MVPVYDVVHTMCDQVNGRLTYIGKYGKPNDMDETFATIIHAAPKLDVEELLKVKAQLSMLMDEKFVNECRTNKDLINKTVAENIDFKKIEDGASGLRMINLADERNIQYKPSMDVASAVQGYCVRKGFPVPPSCIDGGAQPAYIPQPVNFNAPPPSNMPPPGGYGGGGDFNSGMGYQPAPQQQMQQPM